MSNAEPRHNYDNLLSEFLSVWTLDKVQKMTIEEYTDLSAENSFCRWLEYKSEDLGIIGGITTAKFEIWKTNLKKDYTNSSFSTDGTYVWKSTKGKNAQEAFTNIKELIVLIIKNAMELNWNAIENIPFHAIGKWKIAFLYSSKRILPIYSRKLLLPIAQGLGMTCTYSTPISKIQQFIMNLKTETQNIYEYAREIEKRYVVDNLPNYYIIGCHYSDDANNSYQDKMQEFLQKGCVAIGFMDWIDFSECMGKSDNEVKEFVHRNWRSTSENEKTASNNLTLLSKMKKGDIVAVKSKGIKDLTIIAYAVVVERNGSVYSYDRLGLGHQIHVEFLDVDFKKQLSLTYAQTLHHLTPSKDGDKFNQVFGWYANIPITNNGTVIEDTEMDIDDLYNESGYNDKSEASFVRSSSANVTVNLVHNRIQNRFIQYLNNLPYPGKIGGEKNRMDAFRESLDEVCIYEIKPYESASACIREGIGQLLDYAHSYKTKKVKQIAIVGINPPDEKGIAFIKSLRSYLKIQFTYVVFDEKLLSIEEY